MRDYKISVIVPVYNVEKYLNIAFESLKKQTIGFENLEVIFIDDGSTDNSMNLIKGYLEQYNNVKCIQFTECSGAAGRPRNVGIEHSTANYIMFLDPDDYYSEDACQILYETIILKSVDMVYASYRCISESGDSVIYPSVLAEDFPDYIHTRTFKDVEKLISMPPSIWNKIYNADFIKNNNIRFPEGMVGEDYVFIMHAQLAASELIFIKKIIYNYRLRDAVDKSISYTFNAFYFDGVNNSEKLVQSLVQQYKCENHNAIILKKNLDYYINNLFSTTLLSKDQKIDVISSFNWFFEKNRTYSNEPNDRVNQKLYNLILNNQISLAIELYDQVIPLFSEYKEWNSQLEKSKEWLAEQNRNFKREIENQSKIIEDLQTWNENVMEGKKWLEKQIENYKQEINNQNSIINEIRKWNEELLEAKNWLESQLNSRLDIEKTEENI